MDVCSSERDTCLSSEQQSAVAAHTKTIAIATRNMTRQARGGVSYVIVNHTTEMQMYTVRFWDPTTAEMQCISVNGTACAGVTQEGSCGLNYFSVEEGTQVTGSLRSALAGNDITFQMSVTVLNQAFQTQVFGKLTAFSTDSDVVRDLVGSASLYLQNNNTC